MCVTYIQDITLEQNFVKKWLSIAIITDELSKIII